MIRSIRVKNFYSINQTVEIDFRINGKLSKKTNYHKQTATGERISLIKAFIGPNAAGKTTILKAISFVRLLIVKSSCGACSDCSGDELPYKPFAINKGEQTTNLSVEFEVDNLVYSYSVKLKKSAIVFEELSVIDYSKKRSVWQLLFRREGENIIDNCRLNIPRAYLKNPELASISVIGYGKSLDHDLSKRIYKYWRHVQTNIEFKISFMPHRQIIEAHKTLIHYAADEEKRKSAIKTLKKYDLGIENLTEDGAIVHKYAGEQFKLGIDKESSGTRQLIYILRLVDQAIDGGRATIIDEFDVYLHPTMIKTIINRFLDEKINKKHAQLILVTHNLIIFDVVDRHQLVFVEKNKDGASVYKPADSVKGRIEDNIHKKYLDGAYGALPNIKKQDST